VIPKQNFYVIIFYPGAKGANGPISAKHTSVVVHGYEIEFGLKSGVKIHKERSKRVISS
jgi:hypothetical protein